MRRSYKILLGIVASFIFVNSFATNGSLVSIVGGYTKDYWYPTNNQNCVGQTGCANYYLFTQSPSYNDSMLASLFYSYLFQQMQNPQPASQAIINLITSSPSDVANAVQSSFSTYTQIANPQNLPYLFQFDNKTQKFSMIENDALPTSVQQQFTQNPSAEFNFASLIQPLQYPISTQPNQLSPQQQQAQYFIKYITNQFNPSPVIDFSKLFKSGDSLADNNLLTALDQPAVQQYLVALRAYAAAVSVALDNFNYMYYQRQAYPTREIIQQEGGLISNNAASAIRLLPQNLQTQASPLAIDQWMAMRRLQITPGGQSTNSWFNNIQQATPATLQRENVMLLAEIRYELFRLRMTDERILATLSAMELQNTQQQQFTLNNLTGQVCNQPPLKDSGACPQVQTQMPSG